MHNFKYPLLAFIILGIFAIIAMMFTQQKSAPQKSTTLNDPNITYQLRFYTRGSDCGAYINDEIVYNSYEQGFGGIIRDNIDRVNQYLHNGKNDIALKIISHSPYFKPDDNYECSMGIYADHGNGENEQVAFLNLKYADIEAFTPGTTFEKKSSYFKVSPDLVIKEEQLMQKSAEIKGILSIESLVQ